MANLSIDDVTDHFAKIIAKFPESPIVICHSFGGLFTEKLLGEGVGAAGIAIDPAQTWVETRVETRGIEPLTPALQRRCSTN